MRENGNWNNWSMIEIEKYPCNDENEARSRERYWYEVLNANMNTQCPTLDVEKRKQYEKEFYVKNKDKIGEKCKIYRDRNKDKIKQKNNEKHQCKCGGFFTIVNKSHHSKTKMHLKYIQENDL